MFDASTGFAGRVLSYTRADHSEIALTAVGAHHASGLVVIGRGAVKAVHRARHQRPEQLLVIDVGEWTSAEASAVAPVVPDDAGLFPSDGLDVWAGSLVSYGADVVLTRALVVPLAAWEALRAVLRAGCEATRPDVMTLIATDAAMLDRAHVAKFLEMLADEHANRPLAFLFAGKNEPLAHRERIRGLRAVLDQHPGCLLLGVDVLTATDAAARGAGAAVGVTGSLRRPKRPKDSGGGPPAVGFVPGLFLRELWETRSPNVYADWYANTTAPTCRACGGRSMDSFTSDPEDKRHVLNHNIHAWLGVLDQLRGDPDQAAAWLRAERLRALDEHARLRPRWGSLAVDRLLRVMCELDDPEQRRTSASGQWI